MPVTITGNGRDFIIRLQRKLESPDLIQQLGETLADSLQQGFDASGLKSDSGATKNALSKVGQPQRTGSGWSIGVGDARRLGEPNETAPHGTLREFFRDFPEAFAPAWKYIPQAYQEKLAQMRRAGMYGGRGPDYAHYAWAQERGSARAFIPQRAFIEYGRGMFAARATRIVEAYFARV